MSSYESLASLDSSYYDFDCMQTIFKGTIEVIRREYSHANRTRLTCVLKHSKTKDIQTLPTISGKVALINFLRLVKTFNIIPKDYEPCIE